MKVDIKETVIGKAGEYLTCSILMQQGFDCFLSQYELPYDILAEKDHKIIKIQVKTVSKAINTKKQKDIYRFYLRHGKGNLKRYERYDFFAFVALDKMQVAFLSGDECQNKDGHILQIIEFRTRNSPFYVGKGRCFEDYKEINVEGRK